MRVEARIASGPGVSNDSYGAHCPREADQIPIEVSDETLAAMADLILSNKQVQSLKDLKSDMDECIMATSRYEWNDVKHRSCGLSFEDILNWRDKLNDVLPPD